MTRPNLPQREAIRYIDGPLLVLAGAGSGKTRVIIEKIAYLIQHCGHPAKRITAVTFTNKAAQEMTQRVRANLGERAKGLKISTFHALGLNIIRAELEALKLKRGFSIFDAQDSLALLQDLALQNRLADAEITSTCQHLISQWKNDLLAPKQVSQLAGNGVEQQTATLYAQYERSLQAYNAVDFDDLINKPVHLLGSDASVRERWQNSIHYMLVDEYQDTNTSQYRLLQLLTGSRAMFTVVGDDDQSIYSWRGARPENLDILQSDYPRLKVVKLEQNYRSTQTILGAANHLIANNPHSFEKRLWSELGLGDNVHIERRADENDEVE
ncbi:MAG: UvrD-helicase domain-containing protein, partial [Pseudomonadales bacterium]